MADNINPNGQKQKIVVVAGMGPAGLVSAIEAIKKGYHVIIYEPRDYFTRGQKITLNSASNAYLQDNVPKDMRANPIFKDISDGKGIKINELQEFLEKILLSVAESAAKKPNGGKLEIRRGAQDEITGFDLKDGQNLLNVKKNGKVDTPINFEYFVAADGGKRVMAQKINAVLASQEQLNYKDLEVQTRRVPHGTVNLKAAESFTMVAAKPYAKKDFNPKEFNNVIDQLKKLGWEEHVLPNTYMFPNRESNQFYLASEIPQSILDEPSPEVRAKKMAEWGKLVMKLFYDVTDPDVTLKLDIEEENVPHDQQTEKAKQNNLLAATTFELRMQYTDTPCVQLNGKAHFVSVGEATMNANFYLAHGANDAIADGVRFGKFLPFASDANTEFDIERYNKARRAVKESVISDMEREEDKELKKYKELAIQLMQDFAGEAFDPLRNKSLGDISKPILTEKSQSRKLIEIAQSLVAFNKKLKKQITQFEVMIKKIQTNPEEVDPHHVYLKTLELSKHINFAADKKAKMDIKNAKKELKKVRQSLFEINKKYLGKFVVPVYLPIDIYNKRNELISKKEWLENFIKNQEEYEKRIQKGMKGKDITQVISRDTAFVFGFESIRRLREKKPKSSPDTSLNPLDKPKHPK